MKNFIENKESSDVNENLLKELKKNKKFLLEKSDLIKECIFKILVSDCRIIIFDDKKDGDGKFCCDCGVEGDLYKLYKIILQNKSRHNVVDFYICGVCLEIENKKLNESKKIKG